MESGDFGLEKIELSLYLNKNPESQIRNQNHGITPVLHDRDARELMANLKLPFYW
jgi:hypothetical protein